MVAHRVIQETLAKLPHAAWPRKRSSAARVFVDGHPTKSRNPRRAGWWVMSRGMHSPASPGPHPSATSGARTSPG
eukprot:523704-Pyramimonas_sp.AAC.1